MTLQDLITVAMKLPAPFKVADVYPHFKGGPHSSSSQVCPLLSYLTRRKLLLREGVRRNYRYSPPKGQTIQEAYDAYREEELRCISNAKAGNRSQRQKKQAEWNQPAFLLGDIWKPR
jgi:hypothetical protein